MVWPQSKTKSCSLDPYFVQCTDRTTHGMHNKSILCCTKYRSILYAEQSMDCANPYFAHNMEMYSIVIWVIVIVYVVFVVNQWLPWEWWSKGHFKGQGFSGTVAAVHGALHLRWNNACSVFPDARITWLAIVFIVMCWEYNQFTAR